MSKQKIYYDAKANSFENGILFQRTNRNHEKKIMKICELLMIGTGNNEIILEVGAGTGIHAEKILNAYPNIRYVGVDISLGMINVAKQRTIQNSQKVDYVIANGENLPFKNNIFDAAYISGSLHHFTNPKNGIIELIRSLKKGGHFVIMEPNRLFPTNIFAALILPLERGILKMSKRNFNIWLSDQNVEGLFSGNCIYTPPVPISLGKLYDALDGVCSRIPILSEFSIMLYATAIKIRK